MAVGVKVIVSEMFVAPATLYSVMETVPDEGDPEYPFGFTTEKEYVPLAVTGTLREVVVDEYCVSVVPLPNSTDQLVPVARPVSSKITVLLPGVIVANAGCAASSVMLPKTIVSTNASANISFLFNSLFCIRMHFPKPRGSARS